MNTFKLEVELTEQERDFYISSMERELLNSYNSVILGGECSEIVEIFKRDVEIYNKLYKALTGKDHPVMADLEVK